MNKQSITTILPTVLFLGMVGCHQTKNNAQVESNPKASALDRAIFAGGCFWCMEKPFDETEGVLSTVSGYTGGTKINPNYKEVSSGTTGHTEALEVVFDSKKVDYEHLLDVFWVNVDPTTNDRQFCDVGNQYRPGIFPIDLSQRNKAETSLKEKKVSKTFLEPIVLEIVDATEFYPAEEYHQDYYKKNPVRYKYYRYSCGRDARLEQLWGSKDK